MKKIFSFVIVLFAAAMVSCGGNANKNAAAETETVETVTATEVVAGPACDSTCCNEACDSTKSCEQAQAPCCNK